MNTHDEAKAIARSILAGKPVDGIQLPFSFVAYAIVLAEYMLSLDQQPLPIIAWQCSACKAINNAFLSHCRSCGGIK